MKMPLRAGVWFSDGAFIKMLAFAECLIWQIHTKHAHALVGRKEGRKEGRQGGREGGREGGKEGNATQPAGLLGVI
jgi:hypothetical protein